MHQLPQKHSRLAKHETVVLLPNAIIRLRDGIETERVNYDDIHAVLLKCDGRSIPAGGVTAFRTIIKHAGGKFMFSNAIYGGAEPGMDENYFDFVDAFHKQLCPYADRIKFSQGSNAAYIGSWLGLIFAALALILVPTLMIAIGKFELPPRTWALAMMPFFVMGVFIPLIKRGGRKDYGPDCLPLAYLPH